VWRVQWPKDVTYAVVPMTNPKGHLTNSDLEMAGVLLQEAMLQAALGPTSMMVTVQVAMGCDNSPAVVWTTRMATCSASPISFHLLRSLTMCQRLTKSALLRQSFIWPVYKTSLPTWHHTPYNKECPHTSIYWKQCPLPCALIVFSPFTTQIIPYHRSSIGTMSSRLPTFGPA
jgi:hypothetical protein